MQLGPKAEDVSKAGNPFLFVLRFLLGAMAAAYFILVPIYMWLKDKIVPKGRPIWERERETYDDGDDALSIPFTWVVIKCPIMLPREVMALLTDTVLALTSFYHDWI